MLKYNLDNFKSGKTNICFVTGLSGCGKSTLSKKIAEKHGYIHIDLDDFEQCSVFSSLDDIRKNAGEVFYIYFSKNKKIYNILKSKNIHGKELCIEIKSFLHFVINYCQTRSEKYIIEGVQIYSFLEADMLNNHSFIIINKNPFICLYGRFKRSLKKGLKISDFEMIEAVKWYIAEYKVLKKFNRKM